MFYFECMQTWENVETSNYAHTIHVMQTISNE